MRHYNEADGKMYRRAVFYDSVTNEPTLILEASYGKAHWKRVIKSMMADGEFSKVTFR